MENILIVHGSGGRPEESWFPWLSTKLRKDGFSVLIPQFPNTPETQKLSNWNDIMNKHDIGSDTIAIGHSLGAPFILSLLENRKFKEVYLVAGFIGLLNSSFDEVIHTFSNRDFDWNKIRENCKNIHIIYSDNDPYVKPEKAFELGEKLNTKPILIKGAEHFNGESNYFEFEELYQMITTH